MSTERAGGTNWLTSCAQGLQELGFTDYEARAYVALLQCQPATAYEVSKLSGLPRANAYNVFESLVKKMAVQPVSESPVRYVAVDPKTLLGRIAEDTASRCNALADRLSTVHKADEREYVWVVEGEEDIHSRIATLIGRARQRIWIKAPEGVIERHRDLLLDASQRSIEIAIVAYGGEATLERFRLGPTTQVYLHEATGIPVGLGPHLVTLTIDFEEALVANLGEGGYGAYTRSWPIVYVAESHIRHEIYITEIFKRFGPQIEREFGPALIALRRKLLPLDQVSALEALLGLSEGVSGSSVQKDLDVPGGPPHVATGMESAQAGRS